MESLLRRADWRRIDMRSPETDISVPYLATYLGRAKSYDTCEAHCFALTPGNEVHVDADLRIIVSSLAGDELERVAAAAAWVRWIRSLNRRRNRASHPTSSEGAGRQAVRLGVKLTSRPNIRLGRQHDARTLITSQAEQPSRGAHDVKRLNVIELFAGAGGLGLGFMLADRQGSRFRLVASAEVEPIYVRTLATAHDALRKLLPLGDNRLPEATAPMDLRKRTAFEQLRAAANSAGGADIIIGGPPCQGFSSANRNSWSARNPNNELVDVFLSIVRRLKPRLVLLENVQGIMWTALAAGSENHIEESMAGHLIRSLKRSGYTTFPKVLDAVWYGVPQHRSRFFLFAVHDDLGYHKDDFGQWGPFPMPSHGPAGRHPYVSVNEALGDLPRIGNGANVDLIRYEEPSREALTRNPFLAMMRTGAPKNVITDHVTSRHASYVIDRYREISQGHNWETIRSMMSNYSDVDRTHSNIYRRLKSDEPAITIGHYRKSMLIHPTQHRGLSLREAARLQSFPDWFRFAGSAEDTPGGLMHKQQQLANAVCPLMGTALATHILGM